MGSASHPVHLNLRDYNEILECAAAAHGVETEYVDIWGRRHNTSVEVERAILGSLGVPTGSAEEIGRSNQEFAFAHWSRAIEPTVVVREDADAIPLHVPAGRSGDSVKLEIQWECGDLEHQWFWLPELEQLDAAAVSGGRFISKRLPLPQPLRLGYHQIRLYWMQEPALQEFGQARFIVCPKRTYACEGRAAGVALSLYGLRSSRNWGCGDFTDLHAAIDHFAQAGAAFIALNPLHAIPNRQPYNTSPYLPQCSLYRNFIYLDVERVGELTIDTQTSAAIAELRASEFVEYERVAHLKLQVLRAQFDRFLETGGSPAFDRYVGTEGSLLHDFAVYCVLDEYMHRRNPNVWLWSDWPLEYRDPRSPAVAQFAQEHSRRVRFYKFLQWKIDGQLEEAQAHARAAGMRIGLYHDLALATDRWGADLWANRPFYVSGCRVGSPPDDFSPQGQDWAFPPPNRAAHHQNGYELFAQSIRKNARHGGALRIDHVMRFFRLYWIPDGMQAAHGAYVRDNAGDLLGILALESVRGKFVVIGEDLGTVTGEIRHALSEAGILSYRILWFEKNDDGSLRRPEEYPELAAVSTTTHDLPTLSGFAQARDIHARRDAGLIDDAGYAAQIATRREEVQRLQAVLHATGFNEDVLAFLLATPCALAVINQEDLTGETEQQNLPGSTWQHPNWRRKMRIAVEDFGPLAADLKGRIDRSGRGYIK